MIVGLKILSDFCVGDAEELVAELIKLRMLDLTLEQVKKIVEKEWKGENWDDIQIQDDVVDYILANLADGCFYWEYKEPEEMFTINIIDPDNPFTKDGKLPKVKVQFS